MFHAVAHRVGQRVRRMEGTVGCDDGGSTSLRRVVPTGGGIAGRWFLSLDAVAEKESVTEERFFKLYHYRCPNPVR